MPSIGLPVRRNEAFKFHVAGGCTEELPEFFPPAVQLISRIRFGMSRRRSRGEGRRQGREAFAFEKTPRSSY